MTKHGHAHKHFGAERVVFGSDLYSHPIGVQPHVLPEIQQADLGDAERSRILSGNISALLRISSDAQRR